MRTVLIGLLSVVMLSATTRAQSTQTFTFDQALVYAADHYPTVRAAVEQVIASEAGVSVAGGVPAASGYALADQSRDRQQCFRSGPAAVGASIPDRTGLALRVGSEHLEQRDWRVVVMGAV
jgi:hypothetical protein